MRKFKEHGYLWWRSLLVSLCRGARRRRPRPSRLYLALPNWDLSQRPGRVLVRHFDVVCRVARSSRNFGFCPGNSASE